MELADLGYTDILVGRANSGDGFTPLALAAAWEPRLRLGTAIVPAYTRSPGCMAQCVASLADAAPGRFAIGIGSSSNVIVERWNGIPFEEPYKKGAGRRPLPPRCADRGEGLGEVRHLRDQGIPARRAARSSRRRSSSPRSAKACCGLPAARPMERSSTGCRRRARRGSGCGSRGAARTARWWHESSCAQARTPTWVHANARFAIAAYMNVPVYTESTAGSGEVTCSVRCGRRGRQATGKAALKAIPDEAVDDLVVHGSPEVVPSPYRRVLRQRRDNDVAGDPPPRPRERSISRQARARTSAPRAAGVMSRAPRREGDVARAVRTGGRREDVEEIRRHGDVEGSARRLLNRPPRLVMLFSAACERTDLGDVAPALG